MDWGFEVMVRICSWKPLGVGLLLGGLAILVSGCQASQEVTSVSVRVNFVDALGNPWAAPSVAVQMGEGAWQALDPKETITFTLPKGETKYGLAYRCGPNTQVIHLTKEDAIDLKIKCLYAAPEQRVNVEISYDDTQIPGVTSRTLRTYIAGHRRTVLQSNPQTVSLPPGRGDIVLTLYNEGTPLATKVLYNQEVREGAKLTFAFSEEDKFAGEGAVEAVPPPDGFSTGYLNLMFVTPLGSYVFEPRIGRLSERLSYPLVPSGTRGQYVAWVWAEDTQGRFLLSAKAFNGPSFVPSFAAPFSPKVEISSVLPKVSGLGASGTGLIGYNFSVSWKPDSSASWQTINAFTSLGWLGQQHSYIVPDLSSAGFNGARPPSGVNASYSASALFSAQNILEILATSGGTGIVRTNTPNLDRKEAGVSGSYVVP